MSAGTEKFAEHFLFWSAGMPGKNEAGENGAAQQRSAISVAASFRKLVTQQDRDTVASIRGAVARTSKIASHVSKWSSVDAADLAKMHWIHSSELALGSEFPHAVAKKYPRLMPTKHDLSVKRYVILTDEALFLTWYAPRKRKSGSSSASKDAEDEIIAELIKNYDKDGSGGLDIVEVSQFLQEAGGGRVPTHDELLWVMKTATPQRIKKNHDLLGKQELRIEHLRAAALAYSEYRQREAELDEIFDKYDDDDNGVLDRSELTNIVTDYLTETDQTKSSLEALSDEQRKLKDTRPERVKIMVEKLLQASVSIKEDVITKPEMIKALVMIQNEGKSVDPEVEDERSSVVIKMCVTLDTSKNTAHETRSEKSFKEAVKKAAYDVCGFTTGSSEVQVATSQEGEQKQGISSFEEVFAAAEAGALPRAVAGAEGSTISARDFNVSVHIPYTEKLHDDNAIAEVFTCSSFQLHFTVIVQGDLQSISNFKLSKRKLSKRLQDAGWSAKHIEETFSYFPNAFQVSDVLPLTEMVTPLVVDRMARTSRNKGLAAITNRVWKSLKSFWRTRSKMTPVALTVRLSLPMKAHNLNKTLRTELVQATCDALNAAAKSQMVLEPSRVQIRNVKSIASLMPPVNDQETPSAANQEEFEYKWDLFISYRVTSDSDLVEKLYDKITKAHPTMKVFLDKCELVLGESWGQGFADAITHSRVVVLVMSRGTFSCSHGKTCAKCPNNISRLEQSPEAEDNVILEYDLALELFEMGRVKRIVPLLVGDLEDDNRLGKMYLDFFNQFRPCLCWDAIPDKKASAIQKRACHMLSKNPELKVQLDASKDRNLANKKLREGIPSLLRGRTVKQTLHAITCMQGIKLVGLPDSTISEACKRLGDTAWDLHLLDENKEVEYYHGPKMDHTSVEILVDAFHKSHMHQQLDLEEIVEKCNVQNFLHEEGTDKTLKVYESIVKTLHDDHDGLGALILQSTEAENEVFSTKWYAKAFDISFRGRSIQPSSLFSLNKKHFYLKIYFQPDDSADALYGGKELLLQTSVAKDTMSPEWETIRLFVSDEANDVDSSLCFKLQQEGMEEANSSFKIGTPVARKYNSLKSSKSSRSFRRSEFRRPSTMASLRRSLSSVVMPLSTLEESISLASDGDADQTPHHKKGKYGVIKEIKEKCEDVDGPLIGVDFSAQGSDNLDWLTPDCLELLHVGDELDTVIVECFEDGSDTLIGSCITSIGALMDSKADVFFLTNEQLLGKYPFTIETMEDMSTYSMGRSHTLCARSSTQCNQWIGAIEKAARRAVRTERYRTDMTVLEKFANLVQDQAKVINESPGFTFLVYITIIASFVCSIASSQLIPQSPCLMVFPTEPCKNDPQFPYYADIEKTIHILEITFTTIFTVDLLVNITANWLWPFLTDPYNYLDVVVVAMSLADVVNIISKWINSDKASDSVADSGGTGFRVIRIFRLVRVFKLSRVMVDLRIIMDAMFRSLNGVTSAFLIFLLMVVLFSIMATSTFAQQDQELFGTFWRSLVTMLHCGLSPHTGFVLLNSLQGISIDRADRDDDLDMYLWNWTIDVFFSIYILLVFVLVQNLVVVVFLREFLATTADDQRSARQEERLRQGMYGDLGAKSPIDPLLREMLNFRDEGELGSMLSDLYRIFQPVNTREIGFRELQHGLRLMNIHINRDDWQRLTIGTVRPGKDTIDEKTFSKLMRKQLRLLTNREVVSLMDYTVTNSKAALELPPIELQRAIKMMPSQNTVLHEGTQSGLKRPGEGNHQAHHSDSATQRHLIQLRQEKAELKHELSVARDEIRRLKKQSKGVNQQLGTTLSAPMERTVEEEPTLHSPPMKTD